MQETKHHALLGLRLYRRPRGQEPKGEDPEAVKTAKARAKARAEGREAAGGSRRRRELKGEKESEVNWFYYVLIRGNQ